MGENSSSVPDSDKGPLFLVNRCASKLRGDDLNELMDNGIIGHLDYSTMEALDADLVEGSGKGALNNSLEASRRGAYVVSFTDGFERIQLSYVSPASLRFDPFEKNGEQFVLKNFQADLTGVVNESNLPSFDELRSEVLSGRQRLPFHNIDDEGDVETFRRIFMEAHSLGLLE